MQCEKSWKLVQRLQTVQKYISKRQKNLLFFEKQIWDEFYRNQKVSQTLRGLKDLDNQGKSRHNRQEQDTLEWMELKDQLHLSIQRKSVDIAPLMLEMIS